MNKEFEAVIMKRSDDGKFIKQIKLGDSFLSDIKDMSSSIAWLVNQNNKTTMEIKEINWKINSLLSNRIMFNCKGLDFNKLNGELTNKEIDTATRVIEGISDGLYALIDDFNKHRESGDPKVFYDHIVFLIAIYIKIKNSHNIDRILTIAQIEMLDFQFSECITLFNQSISNAISQNNWNYNYNMASAFFGGCYGYMSIQYDNNYLRRCLIEYSEESKEIE
ncbi:hypothetical protein [Alkalispirochaeta alkalica]|uniref:hypothetical protein n=1 Tax=Alkalispirochaeta alkalica TaxID=46356 RepID=UPI0012FE3981|nr:hypothetical protein [Alkalispirochaeta alkalica]